MGILSLFGAQKYKYVNIFRIHVSVFLQNLAFPRIRTSMPKVQLIVSITVKPDALVMFNEEEEIERDYMSINVLESLSSGMKNKFY